MLWPWKGYLHKHGLSPSSIIWTCISWKVSGKSCYVLLCPGPSYSSCQLKGKRAENECLPCLKLDLFKVSDCQLQKFIQATLAWCQLTCILYRLVVFPTGGFATEILHALMSDLTSQERQISIFSLSFQMCECFIEFPNAWIFLPTKFTVISVTTSSRSEANNSWHCTK